MGKYRFFCVFTLFFSFFSTSHSCLAAEAVRNIFILHSYEDEHICGQPQHDGVLSVLTREGFLENRNLNIKSFYMDTKRKFNTPALLEQQAVKALAEIKLFQPEILVTLDDNAFRTVALKLVNSPIQIVFSGLNGQPEDYNKKTKFMESRARPGHNITGVYEKLHIADALQIQKKIFPDLQKVRMLTDLSPTGKAIARQVEIELAENTIPVKFDKKIVRNWEEYKAEIQLINKDNEIGTIYPVALLLKDKNGKTYTAPEIFRWTVENTKKPSIALNYAFTHLGLFGGAAVDFKAMGQQAGEMVVKILRGTNSGEISIEEATRYALVFNMNRIVELGVTIPEDILLAADEVIPCKTAL